MAFVSPPLPVVVQDPTDPDFVSNPYDFYRSVRALGDFVFWDDYGLPVATTHSAVTQVLRHPAMGRAIPKRLLAPASPEYASFNALEECSLMELEPPDHTRIRQQATEAFAGSRIALIAPHISQFADKLIDDFPAEPFDLIDAFAKPLAALTITKFLGVSPEHARQLQAWSNAMVAMYQARRDASLEKAAEAAARDFTAFMRDLVKKRRRRPKEDFLSQLIGFESSGGMSEAELLSTSILLLNAGHEATANTVGNSVHLLHDYVGRAEALAPDSIAGTVEECLRFHPPLHLFKRFVYSPSKIEGIEFKTDAQIGCLLASANRDDAIWPDGELFDPFRNRRPHVAFGKGLHSCIGAALARLELQIALPVLFARCPDLCIAEPPVIANLYHFHGFERLMVAVR